MKKILTTASAAIVCFAAPSIASAQEAAAEPFVGVSVGYHDLGVDGDVEDFDPDIDIDDSGVIYGLVAGVDFPVGGNLFAGVEGNYHLGSNAIDSEYGASLRFGFKGENGSKFYVRGGYQEVDLDLEEVLDIDLGDLEDDIDDTDGDYLVGVGADLPLGTGPKLRVNVDTISFDSVRATVGMAFTF